MKPKKRIKSIEKDINFLFKNLKNQRKCEKALNKWIDAIDKHAHARMDLIELKIKVREQC